VDGYLGHRFYALPVIDVLRPNEMMHRLEADGIELHFGNRKILGDIYLKCETNKATGILGRNGEGKTCLLHIIYGSLNAQSRSIRFDNQPIFEAFKRPELLTYLPQFNFIPTRLPLRTVFSDFGLSFADFEKIFPEFEGRSTVKIKKLSGGQRRLVEVYLIIKSNAKFSILDEPFSHVMPLHIEKISELITAEKHRKGFIITDHLFRSIVDISDLLYVLKDGKTHLTPHVEDIERLGYAHF
jgi:ABC-type lipopolysaccharide export system ATPase subunit